jgi:hypothetical protein
MVGIPGRAAGDGVNILYAIARRLGVAQQSINPGMFVAVATSFAILTSGASAEETALAAKRRRSFPAVLSQETLVCGFAKLAIHSLANSIG